MKNVETKIGKTIDNYTSHNINHKIHYKMKKIVSLSLVDIVIINVWDNTGEQVLTNLKIK